LFRSSASEAAKATGANFGEFMRGGLADFLLDGFDQDDDCLTIAAKAIVELCDEQTDQKRVAAATVLVFLQQAARKLPSDKRERCGLDLLSILKDGCNATAVANWCKSWFGD
jgi:hypothetical protein